MANRIQAAIDRLEEKVKTLTPKQIDSLTKSLHTDLPDLVQYQNLQAAAFTCGKLTFDEATTLYEIYGGELPTPERFDRRSIAERVVGTQTAGELLKMRLCDIL